MYRPDKRAAGGNKNFVAYPAGKGGVQGEVYQQIKKDSVGNMDEDIADVITADVKAVQVVIEGKSEVCDESSRQVALGINFLKSVEVKTSYMQSGCFFNIAYVVKDKGTANWWRIYYWKHDSEQSWEV